MKTLHYFSGLAIALFVGLHILNHLMIIHSESLHISFMQMLRKLYRHPAIEVLLLTAVLVQIISGVTMVFQKWQEATSAFEWIQIISGLYMAVFFIVHVAAVMVGRYKLNLDTNLWYGAGVMNLWPHKLFFIPYYLFALLGFFFHVASIHYTKAQAFVNEGAASKQSIGIMIFGVVVAAAIIVKMSDLKLPEGFIKATQHTIRRDS